MGLRDESGRFIGGTPAGAATRFRRGQSGNPRGRPRGSARFGAAGPQAATALLESHAEALAEKALELALGGDAVAVRFCLGRLIGARRGRPVALDDLPRLRSADRLDKAAAAVAAALADGRLTPEEARACAQMLDRFPRVLDAAAAAAAADTGPPEAPALDPEVILVSMLRQQLLAGALDPVTAVRVRRYLVGDEDPPAPDLREAAG